MYLKQVSWKKNATTRHQQTMHENQTLETSLDLVRDSKNLHNVGEC